VVAGDTHFAAVDWSEVLVELRRIACRDPRSVSLPAAVGGDPGCTAIRFGWLFSDEPWELSLRRSHERRQRAARGRTRARTAAKHACTPSLSALLDARNLHAMRDLAEEQPWGFRWDVGARVAGWRGYTEKGESNNN
jgi:hypothetical protein